MHRVVGLPDPLPVDVGAEATQLSYPMFGDRKPNRHFQAKWMPAR